MQALPLDLFPHWHRCLKLDYRNTAFCHLRLAQFSAIPYNHAQLANIPERQIFLILRTGAGGISYSDDRWPEIDPGGKVADRFGSFRYKERMRATRQ
jgi:hypothetical protein